MSLVAVGAIALLLLRSPSIDYVYCIACESLAHPVPVFLSGCLQSRFRSGWKLLSSREGLYVLLPVARGHSCLKATFKNCLLKVISDSLLVWPGAGPQTRVRSPGGPLVVIDSQGTAFRPLQQVRLVSSLSSSSQGFASHSPLLCSWRTLRFQLNSVSFELPH